MLPPRNKANFISIQLLLSQSPMYYAKCVFGPNIIGLIFHENYYIIIISNKYSSSRIETEMCRNNENERRFSNQGHPSKTNDL